MKKFDIICLGELLIDLMETAEGNAFSMFAGGAACNVAIAASRLGLRTGIIAKTSNDFFGDFLCDTLARDRVDTSGVVRDQSRRTTLAFVTMDSEKKPSYMFYRENAASASLQSEELNRDYFAESRILYFSSMGLIKSPIREANYEAARLAWENKVQIAFDPNIRMMLWPSAQAAQDEVLRMMKFANILKMNDEELEFLFGAGDIQMKCNQIMDEYPGINLIAITLGEKGVGLMERSRNYCLVPALRPRVMDTTGAGDAFLSTLLWQYIKMEYDVADLEKLKIMGRYANAAAAITTEKKGVISSLPERSEVESRVLTYEG